MKFTKLIAAAGLSATLIGTSLAMPVEAFAGNRGNGVSRNAGNRQGNRQATRSNRQTNRFAGPQNRQTSRQTNRGNRTTTFNENRQTRQRIAVGSTPTTAPTMRTRSRTTPIG